MTSANFKDTEAGIQFLESTKNSKDIMSYEGSSFWLRGCTLTDDQVDRLADAIRDHQGIDGLAITECKLDAQAGVKIAEAVSENPNILALNVKFNSFGDDGVLAIFDAATQNPNLAVIAIQPSPVDPPYSDEVLQQIAEHFSASAHPNLHLLNTGEPNSPETDRILLRNYSIAKQSAENILRLKTSESPLGGYIEDMHVITGPRFGGIMSAARRVNDPTAATIFSYHNKLEEKLPKLTPEDCPDLESLRTIRSDYEEQSLESYLNLMPVDNPTFWNIFPEVAAHLSEAGTPITKDFLMQENRDGQPVIFNAIAAGKLGDVITILNAQGETISKDDLVIGDHQPTKLLQHVITHGYTDQLFAHKNWKEASPSDLQQTFAAIPPEEAATIPTRHQLMAEASRSSASRER